MKIGTDIVKIERIQKLEERFGKKALERFLDNEEMIIAKSTQTKAGFWAAKEAVAKALGVGIGENCSFFDIKIKKTKLGAPYLELSEKLMKEFNIIKTSLSISHDGGFAIAVVAII